MRKILNIIGIAFIAVVTAGGLLAGSIFAWAGVGIGVLVGLKRRRRSACLQNSRS